MADYKPWITIHDFPSKGKVVRILGQKTKRIHHLLSQLEKTYFLLLDNDPSVTDIKEQFPLPLSMTQLIAARLGIKHPCINGFSYVMTTDFVYKQDGIWHAVQIKTTGDAQKERVKEKFAIEKTYYDMIKVPWKIVTEKELPPALAANYSWLTSGEPVKDLVPDPGKRCRMRSAFLELYDDYTIPFHTILADMDAMCGVMKGTTMQLFKSCVMDNVITLDLMNPICLDEPRQVEHYCRRCLA